MTDTPIEVLIEGTIHKEIEALRQNQRIFDDKAFELQAEYDKLAAKADRTGNPADVKAAEAVNNQLMGYISAGTVASEKIQTLSHPSELERRVNERLAKTKRIGALRERSTKMADGTPKETAKDQGFPEVYLNENGGFKIGADARAKSDLVASVLGLITKDNMGDAKHLFTPAEAEKLLAKRGWTGFLDRKREIVSAKAKAEESRAKEREAAATAKAAEKAAKAQEREAAKAAAKVERDAKEAEKKAAKDAAKKAEPVAAAAGQNPSKGRSTSKTDQDRARREAKAGATAK
jgi:hypothetical protein